MDITGLISKIKTTVDLHRLENEGEYARWLWQNEEQNRRLGINEYGCADAANILYTIGEFVREPEKRAKWIDVLQKLQNEKTGLYTEETHHFIHTTAHCVAALELFDALPKYPLTALMKYKSKDELYDLLEGLDWNNNPWPQSHQGAGIYAAMTISESVNAEWKKWYFDWFWENADSENGFWKKGAAHNVAMYNYMAGGFHYFFNHESAKMPVRYPEKIIDSCLEMYVKNEMLPDFGKMIGFLEVDWVYCINRASRQTSHRFEECKDALRQFAKRYIKYLCSIDTDTDDGFNDLHMLFGAVCALAELQQALPGEIITEKPLKIVLDRRPFI